MTGIELIAEERRRQIEQEGYTPEHDDAQRDGELAHAAACYAVESCGRMTGTLLQVLWPFSLGSWKPERMSERALAKAGADRRRAGPSRPDRERRC